MRSIWGPCALMVLAGCGWFRPREEAPPGVTRQLAGLVTMRGTPVVLLGDAVEVGDRAPDFRVVGAEFQPVRLSDFEGKVVLISAVPSLDTGVCSQQTKRFNDEAAGLPPNVVVLTVSTDLPFAQKRFCQAEKIERIRVLSDHVWRELGLRYGVLIKGKGLLARAIFVVGQDGRVVYKELVREVATHPDYDAALAAVQQAAKKTARERRQGQLE